MSTVIEAIENELGEVTAELGRAEERVEKLGDYKLRLETAKAELDGQGTLLEPIDRADVERVRKEAARTRGRQSAAAKPAKARTTRRRPAPEPPPSREPAAVASPPVSSRQGIAAAAKGEQRRKAIVKLLEERGGWVSPADIAEELDEPWQNLKSVVHRLLVDRRIEAQGATRSREYRIYEGETRPDENGARTGTERKIVESLGTLQLTISEIAANSGIAEHQAREIVPALVRRGVLECESYGGKSVYGVAGA